MYSYLTDKVFADKKAQGTKKGVQKGDIKIQDDKEHLEKNETIQKPKQSKDSGVSHKMYSLKMSARLHSVQMIITEYKRLVE